MSRLFLHVGYPKTASTTLQKHLFARHPDLFYLGRPFAEPIAAIEKDILTADAERFDQRLSESQAAVRAALAAAGARPALLSHEGFLRATRYDGHDVRRTAERLHRLFAGALEQADEIGVVIVVRNQADLILSHFVQFVKGRQSDLDAYLVAALEDPRSGLLSSLFYDDIADLYAGLFGRAKVNVLAFESLVDDPAAFFGRLCGILGIDGELGMRLVAGKHEKRKAQGEASYLVPDKRSAWHRLAKAARLVGLADLAAEAAARSAMPVGLGAAERRRIDDLYRAANSALQADYGLPLETLGYPVARATR